MPSVSPEELALLERHLEMLRSWNERMSLVSPKSLENAFAVHYADSLFISAFAAKHREGLPVSDLGSGAGFPGLIFAVRNPQLPIHLYEKSLKKQTFLSASIAQLALENVSLYGALPETRTKGLFLNRAVLPPAELLTFYKKRLLPGSRLVVNLGGSTPMPELPPGYTVLATERYELPEGAGPRRCELLAFT